MEPTVIVLSAPVQITAALFALPLIRGIGGRTTWVSIAESFCFMALHRNVSSVGDASR